MNIPENKTALLVTYEGVKIIILIDDLASTESKNALIKKSLENHFDSDVKHSFNTAQVYKYDVVFDIEIQITEYDYTVEAQFTLMGVYY